MKHRTRGFRRALGLVALVGLAAGPSGGSEAPADLVLTGGRIFTADPGAPFVDSLAVRDGRIVYAGESSGLAAYSGQRTEVIALGGRLVVPGFDDAHIHLMDGALSLDHVDLSGDPTLPLIQARIRAFAHAHPESPWVVGLGWLYGAFPGGLPTRAQLDAVVPDRPAYMDCYDGHSGWANSKALALAGITRDTPDPKNGFIVRDGATGEPTGALKEAAKDLVALRLPKPGAEERYALLLRALSLLSSEGITSVQDARDDNAELASEVPLLERALREGRLSVRVRAASLLKADDVPGSIAEARRLAAASHPLLRYGILKAYVDGVVEARTAALLEPYADPPGAGRGAPQWDPGALASAVVLADRAGLQVELHAIGDRGVRMALDAFEAAIRENGPRDRRDRIEHIETLDPQDVPRFRALNVIASMQPLHANPDQNNAEVWVRALGAERASRGFAWRTLEKAGARLAFGSDWPVVTADVFRGLYCAVARKTREGTPPGGWLPEQAVSLEAALGHYTRDSAYAGFQEDETGSLTPGRRADLAVLSANLFDGPPEAILKARVLLTVMDGRTTYREAGF